MSYYVMNSGRQLGVSNYEMLDIDGATALTASKYQGSVTTGGGEQAGNSSSMTYDAKRAVITALAQPVNFTIDGTTPTSTNGHYLGAGDTVELTTYQQIAHFKAIKQGATASKIAVTYFAG